MALEIQESDATDRQLLRAVLAEVRKIGVQMAAMTEALARLATSIEVELQQLRDLIDGLEVENADAKQAALDAVTSLEAGVAKVHAMADELDANDPVVEPDPDPDEPDPDPDPDPEPDPEEPVVP